MPYLILVTVLWAFSFSLIGEYLAGQVDSDFAVLVRVAIAAAVFIPFTRWRGLPWRLLGGFWLAGALQQENISMQPGDLISLGSFSPLLPPKAGVNATVTYYGLPGAEPVNVNFK